MAALNTKPGSSTPRQRQTLVIAGKRLGFTLNEIRAKVGGSIKELSAADASRWIEEFSRRPLPNPPGKKPRPYGRRRTAAARMITDDHCEQIDRLILAYFDDMHAGYTWLCNNFKAAFPRELGTAERAGHVIHTLRTMIERKEA